MTILEVFLANLFDLCTRRQFSNIRLKKVVVKASMTKAQREEKELNKSQIAYVALKTS